MIDYVYVYLNPLKPGRFTIKEYSFLYQPFYIGKGINKRAFLHLNHVKQNKKLINKSFNKELLNLLENNQEPIIEILSYFPSEELAFYYEKNLIKEIGRKCLNTGPLLNIASGGENSTCQMLKNRRLNKKEINKKISIAKKGVKLSETHKKRLSEAALLKFKNGFINYNKGKKLSYEHKLALKVPKSIESYKKGKTNLECFGLEKTLEISRSISESKKGKISPLKGKTFEEIYGEEKALYQRSKSSESHKGINQTEESKNKKSETMGTKVSVLNKTYCSINQAAKSSKISYKTILKRLNSSDYVDYFYL